MNQYIFLIAKWILAIIFVVFGLNKFMGFADVAPPSDPVAQMFMGAMFSSYLAKIVGIVEIIGGILLLINKTEFIGFLLLFPIVFNIVLFHIAHDFIGNGIWLLPTVLFLVLSFSQLERMKKIVL